ncbi:MAG TPA: hypothetical protein VMM84_15430 [Pyrinomonadaceae bacterium]|nr:hypothetical protein [Pyrinomonadaceae bacterium]
MSETVASDSPRAVVSGVGDGTGSLTSVEGGAEALALSVPADLFRVAFRVVAFFVPVFFAEVFFAGVFLAGAFLAPVFLAADFFADFFVLFLLDFPATFLALRFLAAAFFVGALARFFDLFALLLAFLAGIMLPPC